MSRERPTNSRARVSRPVSALALATTIGLAGCSGEETRPILEVVGSPTSLVLMVSVESCNQEPTVDVVESADEVRLTAHITRTSLFGGEDDCRDEAEVRLREVLGNRIVVDGSTEGAIELSPPE